MLLRIQHETTLSYSAPVTETVLEVRMAPPSDEDQTAPIYRLEIRPRAPVTSFRDGFGNRVDLFNVATPYRELVIQATSFVRTHRRPGMSRLERVGWPLEEPIAIEAVEFLQPSPLVDRSEALEECVAGLSSESGSLADLARRAMEALGERLKYEKRVTNTRTPVSEVLTLGRGVCQDFAHLFVGICRGLGLPTRYVSGYVNHPGEIATHAWCQIWAGAAIGWIDIDPTRGAYPGDDYVVIAVGRDYSDIPPNRGVWIGRAQETIAVSVKVEPVDRLPQEWNEWASQPGRRESGQAQSQRQRTHAMQSQWQGHAAYPNQKGRGSAHRQQQGEQQQ
ncbi:MAG: transglutaminase family protein [Isosphaeraceae bacterium]